MTLPEQSVSAYFLPSPSLPPSPSPSLPPPSLPPSPSPSPLPPHSLFIQSYMITGLRSNTTYIVTVAVTNSNGSGNSSTPFSSTTNDAGGMLPLPPPPSPNSLPHPHSSLLTPAAPSSLEVVPSRTSLLVTWSPPSHTGPLPYLVTYSSAAGTTMNTTTQKRNITIQGGQACMVPRIPHVHNSLVCSTFMIAPPSPK